MINLHLLSTPGDRDIRWVLDASDLILKTKMIQLWHFCRKPG